MHKLKVFFLLICACLQGMAQVSIQDTPEWLEKKYWKFNIGSPAGTMLVDHSTEALPQELNDTNFPKTMSLGWRTKQEQYELKKALLDNKLVGPKTCVAWIYARKGREEWPVTIIVGEGATTRINGFYRFGRSQTIIMSVKKEPTFLEAWKGSYDLLLYGVNSEKTYNDSWNLNFDYPAGKFAITKNRRCAFTNVKCKRYEFERVALWFMLPQFRHVSGLLTRGTSARIVEDQTSPYTTFFIEDMCPGTRYGFISRGDGHRLGNLGDFIDAMSDGIPFNRDLIKALSKDVR